jgi:iron complex outermembrane recepter protein
MRPRLDQWIAAGLTSLLLLGNAAVAGAADGSGVGSNNLADLSLEQLMSIEVYSAAKKKQRLSDSAAAVYVLTQDDIRRSGVTTIPEALRLVPGVEVGRISSNTWAITIRGFNERFANKLLVLIDGRSVYTPLFAGVYWDVQDVVLEDVDRIEVIRGPGGTLWGANAVNGVINIITKSAKDTQGVLVSGGAGTEETGFTTARYGAEIAPHTYARVYTKYFERDSFESTRAGNQGHDASDNWWQGRGGFRVDWDPGDADALTVQGDVYGGDSDSFSGQAAPPPDFAVSGPESPGVIGGNVLARWTHRLAGGSETQLQGYFDRTDRDSRPPTIDEHRNAADLDFQHRIQLWKNHDVVWGLGYRAVWDDLPGSFSLSFDPQKRTVHLFSGFVQDEMAFFDDRLRLTLGTKLEHNSYSGVEVQPNARALLKISDNQSLWGAISRAVRTPSRSENDIRITSAVIPAGTPGTPCETSPLPCYVTFFGDHGFNAEKLIAFELGYRAQVRENLSFDVTGFYNLYDGLRTVVPDPSRAFVETDPAPIHSVIPLFVANGLEADTWGFEAVADWRPLDFWTLRSGYTYFDMDLNFSATSQGDPVSGFAKGSSPKNRVFVRSLLDLPHNFELDTNVSWVDNLQSLGVGDYATLDLRVGWRPTDAIELSLVGQNLLEDSHQEFASSQFVNDEPTRVQRGVYGKVTLRF